MLGTEGLNDIIEDPTSDWGDDVNNFEDDDDFDELQIAGVADENDLKGAIDLTGVNQGSRPPTTKSMGSSFRSEGKRVRLKQRAAPLSNFGRMLSKRDPVIESIIETRKFSVIENAYTRLAQSISQPPRSAHRTNPDEIPALTVENGSERRERALSSQSGNKLPVAIASELDNQGLDDGLTIEYEREGTSAMDRSCLQLYEETCKRLNICPCSMIIRSLHTTSMNLANYGLGPRGCMALAAALVRNTTVLSVNLAGNNIGTNGMSHIYQILIENTYIEEYDLSFNNLGTRGIYKLAEAIPMCAQVKTLGVAGNELTASDINILLSKLEDHSNLQTLNISHNQLDEEGGIYLAKWLSDNNILLRLDASWCSIRLSGAKALAKAIGDNNKLLTIDVSHNSFTNETVNALTNSLTRNMTLLELNLRGNELISRYDTTIKENPTRLINGKESQIYKLIVAAATNQPLKIFRLGQNHIDTRCLMIILEALSKLENMTLEELDLTGLTVNANQIAKVELLFANQPKLKCYVGPVRQMIEHFVNNLLNLIITYCEEREITLSEMFNPNEGISSTISVVTHEEFLEGLRRAKIPFPIALIDDMMKYLGRTNEHGLITLK